MSFQPIIPTGGLAGWNFLQRTKASQIEVFEKNPVSQREIAYFKENISKIDSAEQLVSDRRLLQVSLAAFGLSDDLNSTFFIKKVLEEGAESSDALANKLTDPRYKAMADHFRFDGETAPATQDTGFADNIAEMYSEKLFEVAVGEQQNAFRLSLNAERELTDLAGTSLSNDAKWFRIMGSPPLREVFETALNLPSSFGQLDIDKQLNVFRDKLDGITGSGEISQFTAPNAMQKLVERYLLMSQIEGSQSMTSSQIAITLLQG